MFGFHDSSEFSVKLFVLVKSTTKPILSQLVLTLITGNGERTVFVELCDQRKCLGSFTLYLSAFCAASGEVRG